MEQQITILLSNYNIIIIIIIIIKAICNAQDPLKKAANALSGSLKTLLSVYNVSAAILSNCAEI